jgi:hypothetical protein
MGVDNFICLKFSVSLVIENLFLYLTQISVLNFLYKNACIFILKVLDFWIEHLFHFLHIYRSSMNINWSLISILIYLKALSRFPMDLKHPLRELFNRQVLLDNHCKLYFVGVDSSLYLVYNKTGEAVYAVHGRFSEQLIPRVLSHYCIISLYLPIDGAQWHYNSLFIIILIFTPTLKY